jgi:hypothetical protein
MPRLHRRVRTAPSTVVPFVARAVPLPLAPGPDGPFSLIADVADMARLLFLDFGFLSPNEEWREGAWQLSMVSRAWRAHFRAVLSYFDGRYDRLQQAVATWDVRQSFVWPERDYGATYRYPISKHAGRHPQHIYGRVHRPFFLAWTLLHRFPGPMAADIESKVRHVLVFCDSWIASQLLQRYAIGRDEHCKKLGVLGELTTRAVLVRLAMGYSASIDNVTHVFGDAEPDAAFLLLFLSHCHMANGIVDSTYRLVLEDAVVKALEDRIGVELGWDGQSPYFTFWFRPHYADANRSYLLVDRRLRQHYTPSEDLLQLVNNWHAQDCVTRTEMQRRIERLVRDKNLNK